MERLVITIGRQSGSRGREIGERLAEKLGIPLYDEKALMELAKGKPEYEEIQTFYEEEPVNSLLFAIAMEASQKTVDKVPFRQIRNICEGQSCVLLGRCGNYIFKNEKNTLRVFVHEDLEKRAKRTAEEKGIRLEKAKRILEDKDEKKKSFHRFYTREEWGKAENYELCLDSGVLGVEGTADMILSYLEIRKKWVK